MIRAALKGVGAWALKPSYHIMNEIKIYGMNPGRWLRPCLLALLLLPLVVFGASTDEKFPVLTIGARTFTNVTVTTKAADYIFILHDAGMTNLKLDKLPRELRIQLGYEVAPELDTSSNAPPKWAQQLVPSSKQKELSALTKNIHEQGAVMVGKIRHMDLKIAYAILAGLVLSYLSFCGLCVLLCRKAGNPADFLIWFPWLQWIPLYRAAGMAPAWFLADLIPPVAVFVRVVWCFKICRARGKSPALGIALLFPVTSLFTFLYLALADRDKGKPKDESAASTRPVFGVTASSQ